MELKGKNGKDDACGVEKCTVNSTAHKIHFSHLSASTQFGAGPFLFQYDCFPVHNTSSSKTCFEEFGLEELMACTES